jgi:hypothetical protein
LRHVHSRRANAEAESTLTVSGSGGVDGEDNRLVAGSLGTIKLNLGAGVVGVEVDLLEEDLAFLLDLGDLLDGLAGVVGGL